jgi:hypothetical protein
MKRNEFFFAFFSCTFFSFEKRSALHFSTLFTHSHHFPFFLFGKKIERTDAFTHSYHSTPLCGHGCGRKEAHSKKRRKSVDSIYALCASERKKSEKKLSRSLFFSEEKEGRKLFKKKQNEYPTESVFILRKREKKLKKKFVNFSRNLQNKRNFHL